jgi:hypothetical protein
LHNSLSVRMLLSLHLCENIFHIILFI